MPEDNIYWLAKPGTQAHEFCVQAFEETKRKGESHREAVKRIAEAIGFETPEGYYFFLEDGIVGDTRHVLNFGLFDSRDRLKEIAAAFEAKGFKTRFTSKRYLAHGREFLTLETRTKASKEFIRETIGELADTRDFRDELGRVLHDAYPAINKDTFFNSPGTRHLKADGSYIIVTGVSGEGWNSWGGWIAYLTAAGFERLKAWEGLKLIEEDKEAREAEKQPA